MIDIPVGISLGVIGLLALVVLGRSLFTGALAVYAGSSGGGAGLVLRWQ